MSESLHWVRTMAVKKVKAMIRTFPLLTFTFNFDFFTQLPPDLQTGYITYFWSIFYVALFFSDNIICLSCYVFSNLACPHFSHVLPPNTCPCPVIFFIFAPVPIFLMFCPRHLPLPLPSILSWNTRANVGGKTWGKWGQGQKKGKIIN